MRALRAASAALLTVLVPGLLVAGTAAPASAAVEVVDDPAGDKSNAGLDVTRARLENRDHRIVVTVRFVRAVRGDLIVSVDPRRAGGVRLVSERLRGGEVRNRIVNGAFGDRHASPENDVDCAGFRVRWDDEDAVARLVLPSRCLQGGDYGAVRFAVLTERGSDTDYAPEGTGGDRQSRWVPRG